MSVFKRCVAKGCKGVRCDHAWTLAYEFQGQRHTTELQKFAAPRMKAGDPLPTSKADAERWEVVFKGWVMSGCPAMTTTPSGAPVGGEGITVITACHAYQTQFVEPELSCKASPSIVKYIGELYGKRPLLKLYDRDFLRDFKNELLEERQPGSVLAYMKRYSHMINTWCRREYGVKADSPFYHYRLNVDGVRMPDDTPRTRLVLKDEEKKLVGTFGTLRDPLMEGRYYGAMDGCMRRGEMLLVQHDDVLWDREKTKGGGLAIRLRASNTKASRERIVPVVTDRLRDFLKERKDVQFPFGDVDGAPVDGTTVRQGWTDMLEQAGLETWAYEKRAWGLAPVKTLDANLNWHDIRHTGATRLATRYYGGTAMPVPEIQKLLGHQKIETTMLYLNLTDEGVASSMKAALAGR